MERMLMVWAGVFGFIGVSVGAFGAHALKGHLGDAELTVWHTAVQYHLVHTLALALAALLVSRAPSLVAQAAGCLFAAGILLFSGSLYMLALTGTRWLGAITPLGGLLFLAGWVCIAVGSLRLPP